MAEVKVFTSSSLHGPAIKTIYTERQVRAFTVLETEFQSLTSLNVQTTVYFSLGSALLSFGLGIWVNAIFYTTLAPIAKLAAVYIAPLFLVLAVVFYGLGIAAYLRRRTALRSIGNNSTSAMR